MCDYQGLSCPYVSRAAQHGVQATEFRVLQAGSWCYDVSVVMHALGRYNGFSGTQYDDTGFRCAR